MKFVIQRVSHASVEIEGKRVASIGPGMVVLMGIHRNDRVEDGSRWVEKLLKLRIFADEAKPINRSVQDVKGEILLISQFTLYADSKGQNRPSFMEAAPPEIAREIYDHFVKVLKGAWPATQTGEFAADMKVDLRNDGPVTIILE
ncbi:MAG: D-aminoacyl-tRNA deacylase [bacterium]